MDGVSMHLAAPKGAPPRLSSIGGTGLGLEPCPGGQCDQGSGCSYSNPHFTQFWKAVQEVGSVCDSVASNTQSLLEGISDLENLLTKACLEFTCHLLSVFSTLLTGEAYPKAFPKNSHPIYSQVWWCGQGGYTGGGLVTCLLVCQWGSLRRLELDQFFSENSVDICLLNEMHLDSD